MKKGRRLASFARTLPERPPQINVPKRRSRSTKTRFTLTSAQAGISGSLSKEVLLPRGSPSKMRAISSHPTRPSFSVPGSFPSVAMMRWCGPRPCAPILPASRSRSSHPPFFFSWRRRYIPPLSKTGIPKTRGAVCTTHFVFSGYGRGNQGFLHSSTPQISYQQANSSPASGPVRRSWRRWSVHPERAKSVHENRATYPATAWEWACIAATLGSKFLFLDIGGALNEVNYF